MEMETAMTTKRRESDEVAARGGAVMVTAVLWRLAELRIH